MPQHVPDLKIILRTTVACSLMLLLQIYFLPGAFAGQDSLVVSYGTELTADDKFHPDPRKASMYSAVLPGMGQVYNRKYWKVPIVYGGFTALAWYTGYTHDEFVRFRNALNFRTDNNPETVDEFIDDFRYNVDVLTRFKDYYRRQRDRSIIWIAAFYTLNIIDAAVDAHLFEFDVSEDLGLSVSPSFNVPDHPLMTRPGGQMGMGLRVSLKF